MARQPGDLVVRILQEIQTTLPDRGRALDRHAEEFETLKIGQTGIRESIVTALGLSAHANVRNDLMEDRIGRPETLAGELEELKARVGRLETQDA